MDGALCIGGNRDRNSTCWDMANVSRARLPLYVQPRASRTEVVGMHGGALKIRLAAPPVAGAANTALMSFVADRGYRVAP